MKDVRWGMIGCGNVTEVKSGPALSKVADSRLVAVMRRNADKAADYARRHGVPKWYAKADDLIQDPQVNAIYIATPPDSHAEYTAKAASSGKPVYVEKPMARTFDECQQMRRVCRENQIPLFVAYYRRTLPAFLKLKELVDAGAIGEIRLVDIVLQNPPRKEDYDRDNLPWRVLPEIAGGGYFFDLASHQLDYLDYLLGTIATATGHAANHAGLYPAEDAVTASFEFESGVLGSGRWCFTVTEKDHKDVLTLIGSEGEITFATFDEAPIRLQTKSGSEEFRVGKPDHIQQPLIETVVDALLGRGECPSTGETAARTNRVMDEIVCDWRRDLEK
ncbi:Gfo/Idh/MocA family oxidoreductase [bacterium]|nr:Gfo/Idh/MocA family oxidoreductase [bacterium]